MSDDIKRIFDRRREELAQLRRWKSINALRLESLQGLLSAAQRDAAAGREAIASLASERAANAVLTDEVERLRADAERYRYLRKVALWRPSLSPRSITWDLYMPEPHITQRLFTTMTVGDDMDAAIDAARVESDSTPPP